MKKSVKSCVLWTSLLLLALLTVQGCREIKNPNLPPRNPYLADSVNAVAHGDSAQQDSSAIPGPTGPTQELAPDQINYEFMGPANFGGYFSGVYYENGKRQCKFCKGIRRFCRLLLQKKCETCDCLPEFCKGRRVIWSNGGDRITKLDYDTLETIATYELPGKRIWTSEEAEEAITMLDTLEDGPLMGYAIGLAAETLTGLSGVYALLDKDGNFFVGGNIGITVYGDAVEGDPDSDIAIRGTWALPEEITGGLVGMNMTYDGWLILATEHGYVIALSRDLSEYHTVKMAHSEGAAEYTASHRAGYGWVRNPYAIDDSGGIYIVSQDYMHKVIWTGNRLSIDKEDGAWSETYLNGGGFGSGAGTSLMGFGDEDRFVVITDGEFLMNVVLYWREEIPDWWEQLPGAPSHRIAGMLPADMGGMEEIQSEQSVVVSGYGAAVVNNEPAFIPPGLDRAKRLLVSYLGADPTYTPHGVQKFEWDPEAAEFREAWLNLEVSSPNCVPYVSMCSDMFYTIGTREGKWTLEGLDWTTGESIFHWIIGGERYNSLYSGVTLDEEGRIIYGTIFGKVALEP